MTEPQHVLTRWRARSSRPTLVLSRPRGDGSLAKTTAVVVAAGMAAAIVFHLTAALVYHAGYPWNTFLYDPAHRFSDFWDVYAQAKAFRPGVSENMVYSPLLHLVVRVLAVVPVEVAFGLIVAVFVAALAAVAWRWSSAAVSPPWARVTVALVLTLAPYPVAFAVDRGNLDMLLFALLALFFYLYWERGSRWAWLPLGLAIAAKYVWATLLVLLLSDRRFRLAVWTVLAAVVSSAVSVAVIGWTSGYGIGRVFANLLDTLGGHVENAVVLYAAHYGHTLWGVLLIVDRWASYNLSYYLDLQLLYLIAVALVFVVVAGYLVLRDYEPWRTAGALVVLTILLPYENHDYALVFLLLPLALFLTTQRRSRGAVAVAVIFGLLLVPWHYYNLSFWGVHTDVAVSALIAPALLVALLVMMLRQPRPPESMGGGSADGGRGSGPAAEPET
jgi:hypothetical protein